MTYQPGSTTLSPALQFSLARLLPEDGAARTAIMGVLGLATVLVVWQFITWLFSIPVYLVPSPAAIAGAVAQDYPLLLANALPTITEAFAGFLIGNTIAILIKTIPIVAIAPVLKIMLGNGMEPKIAVSALICFFPTLVNAVRGFRAMNPQLLELMHVLSATKTETFRRVRVYSALPYVFSALKISVTMCVLGAIVGEWIGANQGIGYLLLQSMFDFNTPRLFATILTASVIAILGFGIVSWIETRVIRWNPGESY